MRWGTSPHALALLFSACLLCVLVALSGCEDGTPVNAQRMLRRVKSQNVGSKKRNQEPDDSGRYVGSATCATVISKPMPSGSISLRHGNGRTHSKLSKSKFGAESLRLRIKRFRLPKAAATSSSAWMGLMAPEAFRVAYTFGISHFSNTSLTWVAPFAGAPRRVGYPR